MEGALRRRKIITIFFSRIFLFPRSSYYYTIVWGYHFVEDCTRQNRKLLFSKTRIHDRRMESKERERKKYSRVSSCCSFATRTCRRKDLAERTKVTWTLAKRCPFNPKRRHLKSLLRICRVDWQIEANNVAWPRVERRKSWRGRGREVDGWWGREKKRRWKRQSLVERRVINSD